MFVLKNGRFTSKFVVVPYCCRRLEVIGDPDKTEQSFTTPGEDFYWLTRHLIFDKLNKRIQKEFLTFEPRSSNLHRINIEGRVNQALSLRGGVASYVTSTKTQRCYLWYANLRMKWMIIQWKLRCSTQRYHEECHEVSPTFAHEEGGTWA